VLAAKGYTNAVVAISENYVDVIIEAPSLDDVERTQIEELVVRKTGYSVDQVVISCTGEE
jgi:stage III sporulation protein AH